MKNLVKRFMTSALLGFSAFLASGTSLAESKSPKLHASEDAMRVMGEELKDELLQWAGRDVLLLTEKDFKVLQEKAEKRNPEIDFKDIDFSSGLQKQFRDFPVKRLDSRLIMMLAYKAIELSPDFTLGFKINPDATENTHCIIVIGSEPTDIQKYSIQMGYSGLPIENISITAREAFISTMAHEAHHCKDDTLSLFEKPPEDVIKLKVKFEADAEQFSIFALSQLRKNGNSLISTNSTDTTEESINLRSISSFTGAEIQYSFAASLDKNPSNHTHFDTQQTQAMLEAHSFIWGIILSRVSDVSRNTVPQLEFIRDTLKTINGTEVKSPSPLVEKVSLALDNWTKKNDPDTVLHINDTLQETMTALSQSTNPYERQIALLAPLAANTYFRLQETYEHVKTLNNEGAFQVNPLAQKEVDLFIRATEKHYPSQTVKLKPPPNTPGS